MTDFNSLPLADQLKALQAGDELHTSGEAVVIFRHYAECGLIHAGRLKWLQNGAFNFSDDPHYMDIIRVVRPTERKVPEVVGHIRECLAEAFESKMNMELPTQLELALAHIADHFEKGEKP